MVLEPCGRPATIAAGTCRGSLLFMDVRMAADPSSTFNSNTAARSSGSSDAAAAAAGSSGGSSVVEQLSCCVVREVEAHSKVGMSVMVAHPTAPLLATGSTAQVVKVWNDNGDVVSDTMEGAERGVL
jgi:regulator-associated protein of mTOR